MLNASENASETKSSYGEIHEENEVHTPPYAILFIFTVCTIGGETSLRIYGFSQCFVSYFLFSNISPLINFTFAYYNETAVKAINRFS